MVYHDWEQVLNAQFYQFKFSNETESYRFEATGYYQIFGTDSVSGTWFDIRGYTFPLKGLVTGTELTSNWGTPATELGKTVYTLQEDGRISAVDYVQQNGNLVQFGKAVYHQ